MCIAWVLLTGLGLVFLAGGLIFEVGVVLLTPDALQQHIQNSYFGQGGETKAKYKTLADEERGIMALSSPPQSAARKTSTPMEEQPFSDPMTGFMTPL